MSSWIESLPPRKGDPRASHEAARNSKLLFVALHGAGLDPAGLADDALEEFYNCLFIERTRIRFTRPLDHLFLAQRVVKRDARETLRLAHLDGQAGALVEQTE